MHASYQTVLIIYVSYSFCCLHLPWNYWAVTYLHCPVRLVQIAAKTSACILCLQEPGSASLKFDFQNGEMVISIPVPTEKTKTPQQ